MKGKYDNAVEKLKATKMEVEQQKVKLNYLDKLGSRSPVAGELGKTEGSFADSVQTSQLRARLAELERELAVLRTNNTEDIKLKLIQMEHEFEDCKNENVRLKGLVEITESTYKELRGQRGELEQAAENRLEATRSSIDQLVAENKRLAGQNQVMQSKLEKLRKVTVKVPELQHEIETLRESKTVFDRSKL